MTIVGSMRAGMTDNVNPVVTLAKPIHALPTREQAADLRYPRLIANLQ